MTLRQQALRLLLIRDPGEKAQAVMAMAAQDVAVGADDEIPEPRGVPGRPARPQLVAPSQLPRRAVGTPQGHAALLHALAHIEHNAINLALDACWRFRAMPDAYYRDWMAVAQEEAQHFCLLRDHLAGHACAYGDVPAHDGLWEMVERTKADVLARVALVPRTLEARGLDASPAVRQRLLSVGDQAGAAIIDRILQDEIGHVAIGNQWYRFLCLQRGLDPIAAYADLAQRYQAPRLFAPFNLEARRAAGFADEELAFLAAGGGP